jgi:hypothetical protein
MMPSMRKRFHLSRRHRIRWIAAMLICFLFQQVAMAAYVCTLPATSTQAVAVSDCAAMGMTSTSIDKAGHHAADPRCAEHCANHASSASDARVPTVPPLLAPAVSILALADAGPNCRAIAVPDRTHLRPEPPPSLRFCSLLI